MAETRSLQYSSIKEIEVRSRKIAARSKVVTFLYRSGFGQHVSRYDPNLASKKVKQKNKNIPEKFRIVFNIFTGYSHKSTAFLS